MTITSDEPKIIGNRYPLASFKPGECLIRAGSENGTWRDVYRTLIDPNTGRWRSFSDHLMDDDHTKPAYADWTAEYIGILGVDQR